MAGGGLGLGARGRHQGEDQQEGHSRRSDAGTARAVGARPPLPRATAVPFRGPGSG